MKKTINSISSLTMAFLIALTTMLSNAGLQTFATKAIKINTEDDFLRFSESCSLDSWSVGKSFILTCDINLYSKSFKPIPSFGGTFDGNGHKISSINITSEGSQQGLFRYIAETGVVKDLSVSGYIMPDGSKSYVGGIAGSNSGSIISCDFTGGVKGDLASGGIAGINTESGRIVHCNTDARVYATKCSGGIAGKNYGTIINCTNNGMINTTVDEAVINFENIDIDSTVMQYKDGSETTDSGLVVFSDCGGIAGYTSGTLQGCINNGKIGYMHVGYNIGGIAGRQAGYITNCTNYGEINGRKDIGGIVGQMEPYIIIDLSEDTLNSIRSDIGTLNSMINKAIDDGQNSSSEISASLNLLNQYATEAKTSAQNISDSTTDFVDNNIAEINRIGDVAASKIDRVTAVLEDAQKMAEVTSETTDEMKTLLSTLDKMSEENNLAVEQGKLALDELDKANVYVSEAIDQTKEALNHLENALVIDDQNAIDNALIDLSRGIAELSTALASESDALTELQNSLQGVTNIETLLANSEQVIAAIGSLSSATAEMSDACLTISTAIQTISENTHINSEELKASITYFTSAVTELSYATPYFSAAADYAKAGMEHVTTASGYMSDVIKSSDKINDAIKDIADFATDASKSLVEIAKELEDTDPVEFVKLGEEYRENGNKLFASISSIISETENLNSSVYSSSKILSEDIRDINNQANKISDLIIKEVSAITDTEDLFEDTSDIDVSETILGKVSYSNNLGIVTGDRNTGGIAGSMAIDYDIDPEDDVANNLSKNAKYETKAVMQSCKNYGKISGKKDCIGGLIGRMDVGTELTGENYGNIESEGGDYVGGIAGMSSTNIINSFSKCILTGENSVGGIAGSANKMSDCIAITKLTAKEKFGAIAGTATIDNSKLSNNFYLVLENENINAIDNISYSGMAEPAKYKQLITTEGIPKEFFDFKITFVADDVNVKTITFNYEDNLNRITLPEVPEKNGYYGEWESFDTKGMNSDVIVNAIYKPWLTVIENDDTMQGVLPYVVADGKFSDKCYLDLSITKGTLDNTEENPQEYDVYNVKLVNSSERDTRFDSLRLLYTGNKKVNLYAFDGKDWTQIDYTINGKYLIVSQPDNYESYILAEYTDYTLYIIIGCVILVIVIIIITIVLCKKKAKKKAKKKEAETIK